MKVKTSGGSGYSGAELCLVPRSLIKGDNSVNGWF